MPERAVIITFPHDDALPPVIVFRRGDREYHYCISERRIKKLLYLLSYGYECESDSLSTWCSWRIDAALEASE